MRKTTLTGTRQKLGNTKRSSLFRDSPWFILQERGEKERKRIGIYDGGDNDEIYLCWNFRR